MKIALTHHFTDAERKCIGRILGVKRMASRTELIQLVSASVREEVVRAGQVDNDRQTDPGDVPGQLGLFVTETKDNTKQEIAS